MSNPFAPKINLISDIKNTKLNVNMTPMRIDGVNENQQVSFKDTMVNMAKELDTTTKAPDQLLQDAVLGNGADIHDVMIAVSKAELGVNIATQITGKVIQAYEKVIAIQV